MLIELSQLPLAVQEQILNVQANEIVQITNNGQVIKNVHIVEIKSYANGDFDYDLERMKYMMDTDFHPMPKFASDEEFLAWVNS